MVSGLGQSAQLQVSLMSATKENTQAAASCAGEVTTGSVVNKSAPLSRIERLEMYKAKKRGETVKGVSNTKERSVLTATDTSTANVKKSNGWVKVTPHHYTPSPVLARVRKRLEGARPPPARAGARDVASAFKVSMAKTAAENAGNAVGKAPITDSQPISTKVPQVIHMYIYIVFECDYKFLPYKNLVLLSSLYCQCFDLPLFTPYTLTLAVMCCRADSVSLLLLTISVN